MAIRIITLPAGEVIHTDLIVSADSTRIDGDVGEGDPDCVFAQRDGERPYQGRNYHRVQPGIARKERPSGWECCVRLCRTCSCMGRWREKCAGLGRRCEGPGPRTQS